MRILHTSDWHLGCRLYGRSRTDEFRQFLDWLLATITKEEIELLLVAGDIFDTTTPGSTAQTLYYNFLNQACTIPSCRHIVIIGGNHDSAALLDAPRAILQHFHIHIIGSIGETLEKELLILRDKDGEPEALVCAVPYLRDRDIRRSEAGESSSEKTGKLITGIEEHYRQITALAAAKQQEILSESGRRLPIIATGHLFTSGGKVSEGDGVRELYVGTLAKVNRFPEEIDYLALGHLHVPQRVGGNETRRYSGSPIPIGFGEATQRKIVLAADYIDEKMAVREIEVPCFQPLASIKGNLAEIEERLRELIAKESSVWVEIEYTGKREAAESGAENLSSYLYKIVEGSEVEIRKITNRQLLDKALTAAKIGETLQDLTVSEVFLRCLEAHKIAEEEREEIIAVHDEIVQSIQEKERL